MMSTLAHLTPGELPVLFGWTALGFTLASLVFWMGFSAGRDRGGP